MICVVTPVDNVDKSPGYHVNDFTLKSVAVPFERTSVLSELNELIVVIVLLMNPNVLLYATADVIKLDSVEIPVFRTFVAALKFVNKT